jgi:uncharacterized protein
MEAALAQLIADSTTRDWPEATPREITLPEIPRKANAVIGMRRVGKTWFLQDWLAGRLAAGADRDALLYLNLEDERLWQLEAKDLGLIVDLFYRRRPDLRNVECAFVLDGVQAVPGWERFVRRILDTERVRVAVSGSSAKMLGKELATTLQGRSLSTELFPFSYREMLRHRGVAVPTRRPASRDRSVLEHELSRYLASGGFPEVPGLPEPTRTRVLQEYLDVVILRDVIERHGVSNTVALRRLIRQLLANPGGLFSVHRLYNDLKSQGIRVSKESLYAYLEHLEDAYLLFTVPVWADSERVRQSNPRKVFPIDSGLVTACSPRAGVGTGQLLETLVFLELRRRTDTIAYYRGQDGTEIDFIIDRGGATELIQVSADITSSDTRARELGALEGAMRLLGVRDATLVTMTAEETVKIAGGRVRIVPFWMWALGIE